MAYERVQDVMDDRCAALCSAQCVCVCVYLVLNMEKNLPKLLSHWRRGFFDEYRKIR